MLATPSFSVYSLSSISNVQSTVEPVVSARQREALTDLTWKEQYLTITFREWVKNANTMNVDVSKNINKMASVIRDQPDINSHTKLEVWLVYETTMLNIITCQIVHRMAKALIKRTANTARSMPELQHQVGLINQCEKFLMKRLPDKLPEIVSVETAIEQYRTIQYELERMTEKILSKAKPPIKVKSIDFMDIGE